MTPSRVITVGDIPLFVKENSHEIESKPTLSKISASLDSDSLRTARIDFEKQYILRKLREYEGNISRTAEAIGLERSNLHKKIKSYGLDVEK
jgi:two-component system nitrogen regulation response regulator NtrX